ncbi:retinitis pigmentosa 1-like 1 protein [Pelodytes ibericus]
MLILCRNRPYWVVELWISLQFSFVPRSAPSQIGAFWVQLKAQRPLYKCDTNVSLFSVFIAGPSKIITMNPTVAEGYTTASFSPEQPFPPVARPHPVTEVTPAKKITFFKSGDPQFSGVKMAISRRSFKSFSALMDDLSHRVPLPFGVRTVTTPRGTHSINKLEQLQDGGSYICSDKKYVLPIAGRGSGRKMGGHRPRRPISSRKESQQDAVGGEDYDDARIQPVARLRKKITLVKNGDPMVRRAIVLNRRNARNFKTFMEDASDLLQYTVRRLYTVDGRRIENIQEVLQWTTLLICVGREPFKPIQIENARKSISEKLPGLRTHASVTNEAMDNKKNANFGLKAKKSVIHPRSASSNKTRFSISSDKSFQNGLNMSPVNSGFASFTSECPHAKSDDAAHSLVNDDIEKKVHVNKDGSLSVEMKVRFRLLNEETLQWSTQIKKSSKLGKTKCEQLYLCDENGTEARKEMDHEHFSETDDSFYPCDADSYCSKVNDAELEDRYCAHCGMQCQNYDIWKNPMHTSQPEAYAKRRIWKTQSTASSTSSHCHLTSNQKTSIDSLCTLSSEEYMERIIHKCSSYAESRENGETRVQYSAVSRCTSRSGPSSASNTDVLPENGCRPATERPNKSCSCLKSACSMQSQCSEPFYGTQNTGSRSGGFDHATETSSRPCSNGEDGCSQRVSVISHSSSQSRKCHRRMKKINSTAAKSLQSKTSLGEDEGQSCVNTSTPTQIIHLDEKNDLNDTGANENTEEVNSDIPCDPESNAFQNSSRTDLSDFEKSSTRASSCSTNTSNKKGVQKSNSDLNHRQGSCKSPCTSSISKQNGEILGVKSSGPCDEKAAREKPTYSYTRKPSLQSNHSLPSAASVPEATPCLLREGQPDTNSIDNCGKSPTNQLDCNPEDNKLDLPNSRPSSQSRSVSSKYNCVSCPEDKVNSMSSRVSSGSDKKSKRSESSETCDHESTNSSVKVQSMSNIRTYCRKQNASAHNKESDSELEFSYSPTPPKGQPTNKHLRLTKFKQSSDSASSNQSKTLEKAESSRSSTPASKIIMTSRVSTETCKKLKSTMNSSTEEIANTKKRKNSSSSSKRRLKGECSDKVIKTHRELIPSALPNVSSEDVVHEWLRKIPCGTMADYEVEDCQAKACKDAGSEMEPPLVIKGGEGEMCSQPTTETQASNSEKNEGASLVACVRETNNTPKVNKEEEKEENSALHKLQTNNIKGSKVTTESTCDPNAISNNIHTSVQIMKALLMPFQESKFDRSNSLPEVSPIMGRRLSNSAKVLVSCLASLHLLDNGPIDNTDKSKEFSKPKYTELMNIFQALWADGPAVKGMANEKSGKNYSREDELTPASSSGVDVNSGFGGSGDGSITGGGECPTTGEKVQERRLATAAAEGTNFNNNIPCPELPIAGESEHVEHATQHTADEDCEASAGPAQVGSLYVDENMNEKKIDPSDNNFLEDDPNNDVAGCIQNEGANNVNDQVVENLDHDTCGNEKMNNLSQNENNSGSKEANSQETNGTNSPSDYQSIVVSTSDSNGKSEVIIDKLSYDADPVWVLKLLKKIEKEFMTHYVDAMNEFKVKWNLEDNDNLDEMIAELKNEVSQRIQRSIANELKKLKSRAGRKVPRPPDEGSRRKSSLQAEERRRRLQTMHKRSVLLLANEDKNREYGTIEMSCDTDEEDLTFSASFGEDFSGQANGEEFCPCETCLKKKRALKLVKPNAVVADAPIMRAFDLQQILKTKRENNELVNDGETNPTLDEERDGNENGCAIMDGECPGEKDSFSNSGIEDQQNGVKSGCSIEETDDLGQDDLSLAPDENEDYGDNQFEDGKEENQVHLDTRESDDDLGDEAEEAIVDKLEKTSSSASLNAKATNMECPEDQEISDICEETQQDEPVRGSIDLNEDDNGDEDLTSATEDEETKRNSEDGEKLSTNDAEDQIPEEDLENEGDDTENEMTNRSTNVNLHGEGTELLDTNGFCSQKSCLGQCSLITRDGSVSDADVECKEMHDSTEETSPNQQSSNPDSKQSQMYPDSSSDDEDVGSACASPVGIKKKGSFEECERASRKDSQDEAIDQDDLDF